MAINPETQYPGKIAPGDANYPYGGPRNVTLPGDGTGTPWEAALVSDIFGFQQAILSAASVVPSGSPETVPNSQYLESLRKIFGNVETSFANARTALGNDEYQSGATVNIVFGKRSGAFYVAARGTNTDNDGTIITDGGALALYRVFNGAAKSAWFGAVEDGVTDDLAAINGALAAHKVVESFNSSYATASVVMQSEGMLIDLTNGFTVITPDTGAPLPGLNSGGITLKANSDDLAIRLVAHDAGVTGDPFLKIVDPKEDNLAFVNALTFVADRDSGGHFFIRTGAGLERWTWGISTGTVGDSSDDLTLFNSTDGVNYSPGLVIIRTGANEGRIYTPEDLVIQAGGVGSLFAGYIALTGNGANYVDIKEILDPVAPPADTARLYTKDNGAGKTQLVVRFPTGAVQVLATEP